MNSSPDYKAKEYRGFSSTNASPRGSVLWPRISNYDEAEAEEQRASLVDWLNSILPNLSLPARASEEELRACLIDGGILCRVLNRLRPGSVNEVGDSFHSSELHSENVKRFLAAMDEMGLPRFEMSDLEKGSMKNVLERLLTLRAQFMPNSGGDNIPISSLFSKAVNYTGDSPRGGAYSPGHYPISGEERRKAVSDSKFQRALRSPVMSEPSAALIHHVGHKFHEVFQLKQGRYADIPAAKISEMMKSNSLDNAPTQSLLSVINGILDESVERKNGEIPHRVACLLRKVVQEIERRISTQAEHLRTQNNLFKAREEKYQSRIRVLEALATGTSEETQIVMNQLQQIKTEKTKMEEKKKLEEQDVVRLRKEKEHYNQEISTLKQELDIVRNTYEHRCSQMETQAKGAKVELEERLKELEHLLADSKNKVKDLEAYSESKCQRWNKKEHIYKICMDFQFGALRGLRSASESIKQEVLKTQRSYSEEFNRLGLKLKALADAAGNYHEVLAENRRLFNEVQELKGNIRVYCRVRPFLPRQARKQTTIEYIGENGELTVVNPSKQGKDGHRLFKFNKIFGPAATQAEVFSDIQPFIRSVLDGYNVCIFAYGQTGSGKTYTMTGPDPPSKEDWGVNYRALNDLFHISQTRRSSFLYEVRVQMIEIYNEQVRDLLSNDINQKKLGIMTTSQPNGLAVPDASMLPVKSTSDVLELIDVGQRNRAIGATALNERSSRSHSVVTIHVRGTDLKSGATFRGSLHLVDLAGSERVDRSEAAGERLREAQHINKSLSALGDVIFALSLKSAHVPYRNSKLTQVLQSSLGGQAKTLMFVQLNPDANSYSETMSTLKFAERVSGVELGAARSSKEGRDVRELMEQVATLKDTIAKKDEEIERLQLHRDLKNVYPNAIGEKHGTVSLRYESSSQSGNSIGGTSQRNQKLSSGKNLGLTEKAGSDHDNCSESSDKHSEAGSQQSVDDLKHQNEFPRQAKVARGEIETDGSVESSSLPEGAKASENAGKSKLASKVPQALQKLGQSGSTQSSPADEFVKVARSLRKTTPGSSSSGKPPKRWQ
ncbi:kinesin-like protein KIN-14C isoform X2 [Malania oleifera]|uniref:kinesin-like protein KIN-14C isoform X2 n=1 Tax=Malania oleifera TaxID=397392 RepID=UPI0025ADE4FB|nr:kinesin-like protein KIN-14C isoform X2 [Malania oleifera]